MESIKLQQVIPAVFAGSNAIVSSQVWGSEVTLSRGDSVLIEADSGTGKSTFCSYVYGYRNDYAGEVLLDGCNARVMSVREWCIIRRIKISMMFQELRIFTELTAMENLLLKNRLTGYMSQSRLEELLEELGIAEKRDIPLSRLSFGQQQRVAFIRALCQPFDFIFLDEPVSHLDERNSSIMAKILKTELVSRGAGAIITSIGKKLPLEYNQTLSL